MTISSAPVKPLHAAISGKTDCAEALLEWGADKLLVNAVGPGPVMTKALEHYEEAESGASMIDKMPVPRFGTPQDVAWLVTFLLSPAANWITGSYYPIDGGAQLVGRRWSS